MIGVIKGLFRSSLKRPMVHFSAFIQPVFIFILYGFINPYERDLGFWYIALHVPFVSTWGILVFTTVSDIDRDRMVGTLPYLLISATSLEKLLWLRTFVNLTICIFAAVLSLILAYVYYQPSHLSLGVHISLFLKWLLAWALIGLFSHVFAMIVVMSDNSRLIMNFVNYPISLLAGLGFSLSFLPDNLQYIAFFLPFSYLIESMRAQVGLASIPIETLNYWQLLPLLGTFIIFGFMNYYQKRMNVSLVKKGQLSW